MSNSFPEEYASIARLREWEHSTLRIEGASFPVAPSSLFEHYLFVDTRHQLEHSCVPSQGGL